MKNYLGPKTYLKISLSVVAYEALQELKAHTTTSASEAIEYLILQAAGLKELLGSNGNDEQPTV